MYRYALTFLFTVLTILMRLACRWSSGFRAAISRDRIIAVDTDDGVSYHWAFQNRGVIGARRSAPEAGCRLLFTSAAQALRVFLSRDSVGKIVRGVLDRSIRYEGSLVLLLWFDGRIQQVAPLREPFRGSVTYPGAYAKPCEDFEASASIAREPSLSELDAQLTAAWKQREKLLMMRVAAGKDCPDF